MMRWISRARRTPIGLDIGGCNIKAVQLSDSAKGRRVEAVACFARLVPNGPLDNREMQRLNDVLFRRGFVGSEVVLAVPPEILLSATMELPARTSAATFDAMARTEFARMQKQTSDDFEMSYWDLPAPSRANRATTVMATGCTHVNADALVEKFAEVDLDLCGLDVRSWAIARACAPACAGVTGIVAMLELGRNSALLIARHEDVIVYERTLEEASLTRLHETLMTELRVTADVAECVMSEGGVEENKDARHTASSWSGEAKGLITAHLDGIAKDVQASVAYIGNQYPEVAIQRMLLCGGGAMIPGIAKYLQSQLGMEVVVVDPLASVTGNPRLAGESTAAVTIATGLAMFPLS